MRDKAVPKKNHIRDEIRKFDANTETGQLLIRFIMIESILLYTLCWGVSYILTRYRYEYLKNKQTEVEGVLVPCVQTAQKMTYPMILFISSVFTFYCHFSMHTDELMVEDRQNYIINFNGERESPSLGLTAIITLIHAYGGDFHLLLYVTTFICTFITMIAYRYSEDAKPKVLLLLFASQYMFSMLVNLKQCYSSAFAVLFLSLILQKKNRKKEIVIILLMLLAPLFHNTGYILIPLYFLIRRYADTKTDVNRLLVLFILFAIFFMPVMQMLINVLTSVLPSLSGKIDEYYGENSTHEDESRAIVLLKSFPIYIITWLGLRWRKRIENQIPFYNGYLIVCILTSMLMLMGIYNVWMTRFKFLFVFTVYTFYGLIASHIPNSSLSRIFIVGFTFLITYRFLYITGGYF